MGACAKFVEAAPFHQWERRAFRDIVVESDHGRRLQWETTREKHSKEVAWTHETQLSPELTSLSIKGASDLWNNPKLLPAASYQRSVLIILFLTFLPTHVLSYHPLCHPSNYLFFYPRLPYLFHGCPFCIPSLRVEKNLFPLPCTPGVITMWCSTEPGSCEDLRAYCFLLIVFCFWEWNTK